MSNISLGIAWSITYLLRAIVIAVAYTILLPFVLYFAAREQYTWYAFARDYWLRGDEACRW